KFNVWFPKNQIPVLESHFHANLYLGIKLLFLEM
ncbi:MAG: hypothetical protein ACI9DJ_001877, partial [Algoriphagus sp.]